MDLTKVTLSEEKIMKIQKWAEENYSKFYERMYHDKKTRLNKVFLGKIGEVAVADKLGIGASFSRERNGGYDLRWRGRKIAVKTKKVVKLPANLNTFYIHIPLDQYPKIYETCDMLVGTIAEIPDVYIVGFLPMEKVDKVKEYHRVGMKIEYFTLPFPDSYGINVRHFTPIDELLETTHNEKTLLDFF